MADSDFSPAYSRSDSCHVRHLSDTKVTRQTILFSRYNLALLLMTRQTEAKRSRNLDIGSQPHLTCRGLLLREIKRNSYLRSPGGY